MDSIQFPNLPENASQANQFEKTDAKAILVASQQHKQQQDRKESMIAKRKMTAKQKMIFYMWTLLYPVLLRKSIIKQKKIDNEQVQKVIGEQYESIRGQIRQALINSTEKSIAEMVQKSGININVIQQDKKYSNQDYEKAGEVLSKFLVEIIKEVTQCIANLDKAAVVFLQLWSAHGTIYGHGQQMEFVLGRLHFTFYAGIRQPSELQQSLIFAEFVILRLLVYEIILHYETALRSISVSTAHGTKCTIIASLLYTIVTNHFKHQLSYVKHSQANLPPALRIKCKQPLRFEQLKEDHAEMIKANRDNDECIVGLHKSTQFEHLLTNQKDKFKLVEMQLASLYDLVQNKVCKPYSASIMQKRKTEKLNYQEKYLINLKL